MAHVDPWILYDFFSRASLDEVDDAGFFSSFSYSMDMLKGILCILLSSHPHNKEKGEKK